MKFITRLVATACAAATGATVWAVGAHQEVATANVANEAPPVAVEDFNYPGADKILAEKGIILKRGDGHIVYADCASETGLLEILARDKGKVCFRVTGNSGWLTLEIPSVYLIKGSAEHEAQVDMTVDTEEKSFDVAKGQWTPVGESTDEQGREHTLIEIRTSK
ncbi:hypothetical protein ABZ684_01185 [Streptomyces sp. NPDC006995]|uniref:hypothetical protein n=1 Tax=Streptomyces sp. NPDC006995 TaxID=3156907 RepID=UPI000A44C854|nr:hypothetical protein [Streptomyces sp. NBRC 110465]